MPIKRSTEGVRSGSAVGMLGTLMWVVVLTVVIAFALTAYILVHAGRVQDEDATEASQRQVEGMILMLGRHLARHVHDYANWDEAFEAILVRRDPQWWDENTGEYVLSTFDLALTLAVDDFDRPLFMSTDQGTLRAPIDDLVITPSLRALLETARRDALSGSPERLGTVGLIELDGRLYLAAVSPILREHGASIANPVSACLLFALSVENRLVDQLEQMLGGVHVVRGAAHAPSAARVPLILADGGDAGALTWRPSAPGRSIIGDVLPLAVPAFISIAALTLLFAARARALARSLMLDALSHRSLSARYESILENASDGIFGVDAEARVLFANPAAAILLGYPHGALQGRDAYALIGLDPSLAVGPDELERPLVLALTSGESEILHSASCRRADGASFPVEYSARPIIEDGRVTGAVVVFRDVTKRRESEEEMFHRANYDALTGLPNRTLLLDRFAQELKLARREHKRVGVLFIDLDDFKVVNDSFGHQVGDLLLRQVGERLQRCVRETDTVARFGGDEFIALLLHVEDRACTEAIAAQMIAALQQGFTVVGHAVRVGASVGIAQFPEQGDTPETLIQRADAAMYRAKADGRGHHRMAE